MWLKLDLSGINFEFRILHYVKSTKEKWDDEWCSIGIAYQSGKWLNYVRDSDDTLLSCEIETILDNLSDLLDDRLEFSKQIEFIEPDFALIFNPKKDLTKDARYTYIAPGYEIEDIDMEWRIFFWNDGLTENYLSLRFYREDLIYLQKYLSLITGKISKRDIDVQKMIENGVLY